MGRAGPSFDDDAGMSELRDSKRQRGTGGAGPDYTHVSTDGRHPSETPENQSGRASRSRTYVCRQ